MWMFLILTSDVAATIGLIIDLINNVKIRSDEN